MKKRRKKGSGTIDGSGYRQITVFKGYRPREHRYMMEQHLGRKLDRSEHVHHINGNKLDNRIENLEVVKNGPHQKLHIKRFKSNDKRMCNKCNKILPNKCFSRANKNKPTWDQFRLTCKKCSNKHYYNPQKRHEYYLKQKLTALSCPA